MTMLRHSVWGILLTICLLMQTACGRHEAAYQYCDIQSEGWEPADTLHFRVDTLKQTADYLLSVGLRTTVTRPYPFRTVWLVVKTAWHNPSLQTCDTIECKLTNEDGEQLGDGVSLIQYNFPLRRLTLRAGQSGQILIHHFMQREQLEGITDVGIRMER